MTIQDKLKSVRAAIQSIEKQFGKNAIMPLGQEVAADIAVIGCGSPSLARALGVGGYPRGRIVEIFGPESSGKTTLTLHAIAECQKAGGLAAFIDAEHALDVTYAKSLGVQPETLLISQPDTGEQALEIVDTLVRSNAVDLIVVDSVAALVPQSELEGDMGDPQMGAQARLMSQALRKLTPAAHKGSTTIMFINQLRQKIGVTFGNPETTTGGNALKFYASMRLDVRRIGQVKAGETLIGNRTRVKVVKNKLAPPFGSAEFDIRYGGGIDRLGDLLDTATEAGVVTKNGAYYSLGDESLGQGRERARTCLLERSDLCQRLEGQLALKSAVELVANANSSAASQSEAA
ncbi:MAG: RecA protein [Myxococcaceae bacterium]|nr:RecA protein [Myxococcaceae bacterium]